jgi:hypothetical protein
LCILLQTDLTAIHSISSDRAAEGEQSPTQFARYAGKTARETGKSALSLFNQLDTDTSGGLSAEELKSYKSLLL